MNRYVAVLGDKHEEIIKARGWRNALHIALDVADKLDLPLVSLTKENIYHATPSISAPDARQS
jgi:hypothetical protein